MNPCRILIVEDDAGVATDIEARLTSMGYRPSGRATSGQQALAFTKEQHPDLVLMDIGLRKGTDGIDAAEALLRRFHVPVVFLNPRPEDATRDDFEISGPFGLIRKPFHHRDVQSAIDIALYKHRADEELRRLDRFCDVLSQVSRAIVRSESREELLSAVCRLAVECGGIDLAWVGWLEPDTAGIRPVARYGALDDVPGRFGACAGDGAERQDPLGTPFRAGEPLVCNECGRGGCLCRSGQTPVQCDFRSSSSFPLRMQGRVCAVLSLCAAEPGFFREREIQLLEEAAQHVSRALDRIEGDFEREQAKKALEEESIRRRILIDRSRDGIVILDQDGKIVEANQRFADMLGYSADECHRLHVWDWDLRWTREELLEGIQEIDAAGVHFETRHRRKDGTSFDVEINANGAVFAGRKLVFCVSRDISERRKAEEEQTRVEAQLRQAQKMEALGTLAGGIAHDFNNILGIIMGYSEMAHWDAEEGSAVRDDLKHVFNAANRARELVRQILAFSRRSEQEKKPIQIGLIVKEALMMLRASLPSTIDMRLDVVSKAFVLADPTQIHQVLMNLCTNAAHAMREKGGVLEVGLTDVSFGPESVPAHSDVQPGHYVQLLVKDTGLGIAPAALERIFDPFFTTKEMGVGTGLGLSVVHGIVKSHGGAVTVESRPGEGATFRVLLPAMGTTLGPEAAATAPPPPGRERILIVDDEPELAMVAKQMLEFLGYEVEFCTNGIEALETFRRHLEENPFHLVVTDMTMPRLTGEDLARELLSLQPNLPIVLCTGFSERMDVRRAKKLGIRGFLMKPVVASELAGMIREMLDDWQP